MENSEIIYKNLQDKIPFAFSKFNDGEHTLLSPNSVASRGYQNTSFLLRSKLFESLIWTHPNYYLGVVCKDCYPVQYETQLFLRGKDNCNYLANTLINSNLEKTINTLKKTLPIYENIYIILSKDANPQNIEKEMGIIFKGIYQVENSNAFDTSYNLLKDEIHNIPNGSIVLFCCGPLGRILTYEWFKSNNQITCLELGSLFDPVSKNTAYLYHYGALNPCNNCNPIPSKGFTEYLNKDTYIEHFYIPIKNSLRNGKDSLLFFFKKKEMEYEYLYTRGLSTENNDEKIGYFRDAYTRFPGKWEAGLRLYQLTHDFSILKNLFNTEPSNLNEHSDMDVYNWEVYYAISVNAWYAQEMELGKRACEILLQKETTPEFIKESTRNNIQYY